MHGAVLCTLVSGAASARDLFLEETMEMGRQKKVRSVYVISSECKPVLIFVVGIVVKGVVG